MVKQTLEIELVIVDCSSKDNTVSEIERFFASGDYKNSTFEYKFEIMDYNPIGMEDWNGPIRLSKGKYIAMLEGDDKWLPNHLLDAYDILSENSNVGIYGPSNLTGKHSFHGLLENDKARDFCYIMNVGPVPPSESIFIRLDNNKKPFLYNSVDYKYLQKLHFMWI